MSARQDLFKFKNVALVIIVAGIYFLAAKLGLSLAFLNASVSPVWPPTGVAIALVLWFGYRAAPGVFLGALIANYLLTSVPFATAAGIAIGNGLEAVTAVYLLRRFVGSRNPFNRAYDVLKFIVFAAIVSTMVSATIGNLSLILGGAETRGTFNWLWLTWWLGDCVGALMVTPLIICWIDKPIERWRGWKLIEAALLLVLLALLSATIYTNFVFQSESTRPWGHITIPLLLWAAFRFGPRGVATAIAVLSAIAVWGTAKSYGPFAVFTANESLLYLQAYIADLAVTTFALAAIVTERRHAQQHLAGTLSITRILADSPALADALPRILQRICTTFGWELGAMWALDSDVNQLRCLKVWPTQGTAISKFEGKCCDSLFPKGIGLPGRVWKSLIPAWIPDVTKDDNFPRAAEAAAEGLHAAFAFPILSGEKFLGVMEFFSHEIREPDASLLAEFSGIGSQIGQFIDRKHAEEAIELASLLPEENPAPVIRLTEGKTLSYVNTAGMRVLSVWDLSLGDEAPTEISRTARLALSQGSKRDLEISIGQQTYLISFVPVTEANYVNLYFSDITERRRAESELEELLTREQAARTDAEKANRIKDEFLATLSHELRTPLTAMLGWLSIMRTQRLDAETANRALETIERNAQAQAKLIEDLVDVSRIVGGKLDLDVRPIDPFPVIEAAIEVVRPGANAKGIRIEIEHDHSVAVVSADSARLQQIVWNLLSNAVKFTSRNGVVQVSLRRAGSSAEIVVSDTGLGIPPEFLPHVFERFSQAESPDTRSHRGLGLGLAIVRHLTELHGGTVRAESEGEGKGATFRITIPLTALEAVASDVIKPGAIGSRAAGQPTNPLDGLRVLVIEDEPDARELLSLTLKVSGARVKTVQSAQEALNSLRHFKPDVLLSDIGLPTESGYDLIRKVRALPSESSKIPAVALTAFASEKDRDHALSAGFQIHLAKPVDPNVLIKAIENLARQDGQPRAK